MADFFHAWHDSLGKIFEMRVNGASRIAALYHGWKGDYWREIRQTDKRLAGYRYNQRAQNVYYMSVW